MANLLSKEMIIAGIRNNDPQFLHLPERIDPSIPLGWSEAVKNDWGINPTFFVWGYGPEDGFNGKPYNLLEVAYKAGFSLMPLSPRTYKNVAEEVLANAHHGKDLILQAYNGRVTEVG